MEEKLVEDIMFPPQSSIKLVKYAKGYGWEIKRYCDDLDIAFGDIVAMNDKMRKQFGNDGA